MHQARESLTQSWKDRLSAISLIVRLTHPSSSRRAAYMTCARLTDNILRSHRGSAPERDYRERERNKSRECRNRRLDGRARHSLFRRYLPHHKDTHHPSPTTNLRTAIISFLAAFFLISYTINEARHELKFDPEFERTDSSTSSNGQQQQQQHHVRERSVMKRDARIVQICRFDNALPPLRLLERCTNLCMLLTATGFILEIMAILCFAWDKTGVGVSSAATGLTLFCLIASLIVVRPPTTYNAFSHRRFMPSNS